MEEQQPPKAAQPMAEEQQPPEAAQPMTEEQQPHRQPYSPQFGDDTTGAAPRTRRPTPEFDFSLQPVDFDLGLGLSSFDPEQPANSQAIEKEGEELFEEYLNIPDPQTQLSEPEPEPDHSADAAQNEEAGREADPAPNAYLQALQQNSGQQHAESGTNAGGSQDRRGSPTEHVRPTQPASPASPQQAQAQGMSSLEYLNAKYPQLENATLQQDSSPPPLPREVELLPLPEEWSPEKKAAWVLQHDQYNALADYYCNMRTDLLDLKKSADKQRETIEAELKTTRAELKTASANAAKYRAGTERMLFEAELGMESAAYTTTMIAQPTIWSDAKGQILRGIPEGLLLAEDAAARIRSFKHDTLENFCSAIEAVTGAHTTPFGIDPELVQAALDGQNKRGIHLSLARIAFEEWQERCRDGSIPGPISFDMDPDSRPEMLPTPARASTTTSPRHLTGTTTKLEGEGAKDPPVGAATTEETHLGAAVTSKKRKRAIKAENDKDDGRVPKKRGIPGTLDAESIKRIADKRQQYHARMALGATKEDLQRTMTTTSGRDIFVEFGIFLPEGCKLLTGLPEGQQAWICTAQHPSRFHPMYGYAHKSCLDCKSSRKMKKLDIWIPSHEVYLYLMISTTIDPAGKLLVEDVPATAPPITEKDVPQFMGDKSLWKMGATFTKSRQEVPQDLEITLAKAQVSATPILLPAMSGSDLTGMVLKNGKPIINLLLHLRIHKGDELPAKWDHLRPRAVSERMGENTRIKLFHAKRLKEVFGISDPVEDVGEVVEQWIAYLERHDVIPEHFDVAKAWFLKKDWIEWQTAKARLRDRLKSKTKDEEDTTEDILDGTLEGLIADLKLSREFKATKKRLEAPPSRPRKKVQPEGRKKKDAVEDLGTSALPLATGADDNADDNDTEMTLTSAVSPAPGAALAPTKEKSTKPAKTKAAAAKATKVTKPRGATKPKAEKGRKPPPKQKTGATGKANGAAREKKNANEQGDVEPRKEDDAGEDTRTL
ncbi:hypothetical protein HBI22_049640 [Parastagonospora nodorum]|nr:hypothetical protein HBI28_045390 [Parastagonospora nodorum]KAH5642709.1 hypothetical protein HBI22_049640 [Parastagonospora nodorum]